MYCSYGCNLRLMECVQLQVQDIDFERSPFFMQAES